MNQGDIFSQRHAGNGVAGGGDPFSVVLGASANTVYKIVMRYTIGNFPVSTKMDIWVNGGSKSTYDYLNQAPGADGAGNPFNRISIGQFYGGDGYWKGMKSANGEVLEMLLIKNAVSDADVATLQTYQTNKFGS
jgi:hypothetical protein